jgi:hypothetical protein
MKLTGAKTCRKCGETKPLEDFGRHPQQSDGRDTRCKACKNAVSAGYYKRWTPEQRAKHRARVLRSRYGITPALIGLLYEQQEGCCAICGKAGDKPAVSEKRRIHKDVLCVDHDHETGETRALLCIACNTGLGHFKDSPAILAAALVYLLKE